MNYQAILGEGSRMKLRDVIYEGTTYLFKGQGLCYNFDKGTATDADGNRMNYVELPSTTNNRWFAGVTVQSYKADPAGFRIITIAEPGSVAEVAVDQATTLGTTVLTCSTVTGHKGIFSYAGLMGRGTAIALQTKAAATTGPVGAIAASTDGSTETGADGVTITKTGLFANALVGDYVYVLGGGTKASSAVQATQGRYTIVTRTSDDVVVVDRSICVSAAISIVVVRKNPTVLAWLCDGDESGLTEWVSPKTAAAAQHMVGGTTFVAGGMTMAGDSTSTLANGTRLGERKYIVGKGTLTTKSWVLTVTTGVKNDGTTGITTIAFDAAAEQALFEWTGPHWSLVSFKGATVT